MPPDLMDSEENCLKDMGMNPGDPAAELQGRVFLGQDRQSIHTQEIREAGVPTGERESTSWGQRGRRHWNTVSGP